MVSRAASRLAAYVSMTRSRRRSSRSSSPERSRRPSLPKRSCVNTVIRSAKRSNTISKRRAMRSAFSQYDAADPANRLVAGELETRWNKALTRVTEVETKIANHEAITPSRVESSPLIFTTLADDLRAVWTAPTTNGRLKKRIVRTLISEVIADIDADAAEIILVVHWMGGVHTELRLPLRRKGQRNSTAPDIVAAVRQLVLIANDNFIAGTLRRSRRDQGGIPGGGEGAAKGQ